MTSAGGGSRGTDRPGGRRRRPAPTIELTATEITNPSGRPQAETPGAEPDAPPIAADAPAFAGGDASDGPDRPGSAARAEHPPQQSTATRAWTTPGPLIATIAAIVFVVVVAGLWLGTLASQRDGTTTLAVRLGAIESELRGLAGRPLPAGADPRDVAALAARLAAAEEILRRLDRAAERMTQIEDATARQGGEVAARLRQLERTAQHVDEIGARVAKIESTLAVPRPAATDPALIQRLAAAEGALTTLAEQMTDLRRQVEELIAAAREAGRRAASERAASQSRGEAGADRALRLAVLAGILRTAVERGDRFAAELDAVRPFVAETALLAPLEAVAATGVPSTKTLADAFTALAPALIAASAPTRNGGILDRLQVNAERLVRIRPVGEAAGDDPHAVVARIESATTQGDIVRALAEIDKLPPPAQGAAAEWVKRAKIRVAAIESARRLAADAFASLGRTSP